MRTLTILFILLFTTSAYAGSTQSNVSGSNTAIEGGYTSSTTYESGSSSASTTSNTTSLGLFSRWFVQDTSRNNTIRKTG